MPCPTSVDHCRRPPRQSHGPRRPLLAPRRGGLDQGRTRHRQRQSHPHARLQRHRRRPGHGRRQPARRPRGHARVALPQARGPRGHREGPRGPPDDVRHAGGSRACRASSRVGRLDINTEGLLLLTNDGGLKRVLELPATGWLRRIACAPSARSPSRSSTLLKAGLEVEGIKYGPIEATLEREQGSNVWLRPGTARGQEPRGQERAGGARPRGQPADPHQLRAVPAQRPAGRRGRGGEGPRARASSSASGSPTKPGSISTATCRSPPRPSGSHRAHRAMPSGASTAAAPSASASRVSVSPTRRARACEPPRCADGPGRTDAGPPGPRSVATDRRRASVLEAAPRIQSTSTMAASRQRSRQDIWQAAQAARSDSRNWRDAGRSSRGLRRPRSRSRRAARDRSIGPTALQALRDEA